MDDADRGEECKREGKKGSLKEKRLYGDTKFDAIPLIPCMQ